MKATFYYCYVLDEVIGFPIQQSKLTSNCFGNTFYKCNRLKDIIFQTNEDGTPEVANWSNQTIDLSRVGFIDGSVSEKNAIVSTYNSGITADKYVDTPAAYEALKNDPDWFGSCSYSRYDHASAMRTINSLPDCSSGSGNTIKFKGAAGLNTDGGAINTFTEEEIAIATAKGWTVSYV
jgi:hypothetical protein